MSAVVIKLRETDPVQQRPASLEVPAPAGEVVPFGRFNLDTVYEAMRVLRSMDDQEFLDSYNRQPSNAGA